MKQEAMEMSVQTVGATIPEQPVINTPPAAVQPQPDPRSDDRVTLEKVAKGATKCILGAPAAAVWGTFKGAEKALQTAGDSAVDAAGIGKSNFISMIIRFSPYLAGGLSLALGAGPLGAAAAALAAPGIIGGTVATIDGAGDGITQGVNLAAAAGDRVKEKVEPKYGEKAGKAAKVAAGILAGVVTVPLMTFFSSIDKGFEYAKKVAGIKQPASSTKEALGNLGKFIVVAYGFMKGALASTGVIGAVLGAGQGGGGMATTISGGIGGVKGFAEGAKEAYGKVSQFVDNHWEKAK